MSEEQEKQELVAKMTEELTREMFMSDQYYPPESSREMNRIYELFG